MDIEALYQLDVAPAVQRLLCHPVLDLPMEGLSIVGEGWSLVLIALALAWRANPGLRPALRSALRGLLTLAVTGVLVQVIKPLVHAPRPLQVLGPDQVRVLLEPLRLMSFPSGHSAGSMALAAWAWREPSAKPRRWPWIFALLVGLSRVYVGAHWATDVVAGWLLGLAVAVAVGRAWPRQVVAGPVTDPGPAEPPAPAGASGSDS